METVVFLIAAVIILAGAVGVVISPNPVHAALSLVMTLFGIAVLFVAQDAHFLAVVQIIVYAGAIVVLFLFVIMLLGVDQVEDLETEPLAGQRPGAIVAFAGLLGTGLIALFLTYRDLDVVTTGRKALSGALSGPGYNNITRVAESLFTDYLFAFEITSVLLVIAVVAAVTLAKRGASQDDVEVDR
jgi:NADH-quinone oxidoreductase subunit J